MLALHPGRLVTSGQLADVAETDFGRAAIARLDELRLITLEHRVDAELRTGPPASLVAELEGLVIARPMRETLAARLMRALQLSGQRGAALEVRAELTSFVGRDAEFTQVAELLAAHRLVTLIGPGGAGKTRLAVEAARAELDATTDGVWLVELAQVTDPADVAPAVLGALGRLLAALAARQALWTVGPLTLPPDPAVSSSILAERAVVSRPAQAETDGALLDGAASVRLLAQRARAVLPGFEVTQANAWAVARICRALDGMPLAIELAAARLRTMAPEQVAARLDDRFQLLTGGSRTAVGLAAAFGWYWWLRSMKVEGAELSAAIPDPTDPVLRVVGPVGAYFGAFMTGLEGRHDVARAELLRAMELTGSASMERHLYAKVASGLGYLAGVAGDLTAARGWHAEALAAARLTADAPIIGAVLVGLADLALREADPGRAAELLAASLAIRGTTDRGRSARGTPRRGWTRAG